MFINILHEMNEGKGKGGSSSVKARKSRVKVYDTIKDALNSGASYGTIFSTKTADRLYVISKPTWGDKSREGGNTKIAKGFTPGSATPAASWPSIKSYAVRTMIKHGKTKAKRLTAKYGAGKSRSKENVEYNRERFAKKKKLKENQNKLLFNEKVEALHEIVPLVVGAGLGLAAYGGYKLAKKLLPSPKKLIKKAGEARMKALEMSEDFRKKIKALHEAAPVVIASTVARTAGARGATTAASRTVPKNVSRVKTAKSGTFGAGIEKPSDFGRGVPKPGVTAPATKPKVTAPTPAPQAEPSTPPERSASVERGRAALDRKDAKDRAAARKKTVQSAEEPAKKPAKKPAETPEDDKDDEKKMGWKPTGKEVGIAAKKTGTAALKSLNLANQWGGGVTKLR
jgi:hypothetical protein